MRRILILSVLALILAGTVTGVEMTAPPVPPAAADRMPQETENFGQALLEIIGDAMTYFRPDLKEAVGSCMGVLAGVIALSMLSAFPGHRKGSSELAGAILTGSILLRSTNSMIALGADTVFQLSEYGKLLLPVMAGALAAQGGVTAAASVYTGTALFDAVLGSLIAKLLVPMIYLFLALAAGNAALGDPMLKKLRDGVKWSVSWCLKTILYVYTGYIGISGIVSGTTDAGLLKAAKLTISGAVPVVGGILSDASEAVLISAGTVKNAAGIYGMLAILAVWIGPFLKIGAHYLSLKALEIVCGVFDVKSMTGLISDFAAAMGLLLAMTGAVCLMLIISTICFMKGAGL